MWRSEFVLAAIVVPVVVVVLVVVVVAVVAVVVAGECCCCFCCRCCCCCRLSERALPAGDQLVQLQGMDVGLLLLADVQIPKACARQRHARLRIRL